MGTYMTNKKANTATKAKSLLDLLFIVNKIKNATPPTSMALAVLVPEYDIPNSIKIAPAIYTILLKFFFSFTPISMKKSEHAAITTPNSVGPPNNENFLYSPQIAIRPYLKGSEFTHVISVCSNPCHC